MSCTLQMMCYILKDNVLYFWMRIFSQIPVYKILVKKHAIYWYVYVDFYLLYDTSISAFCYKPNNSILTYFSLSFCNTSIQFDIFMCIFYLLKSKAHQFSALFFLVPVHILSQIDG